MDGNKMTTLNIGTENIVWDLSFLYSSVNDPAIDRDVEALVSMVKKFNENYRGNLSVKLGGAIKDYAEFEMLASKIFSFLSLKQSQNVLDALVKAKIAEVERILSGASGEYLSFFSIELVAIPDDILEKLYESDEVVKRHKPWIEHSRLFRLNLLSEEVESALTKRSPFSEGAWSEFFDELESDLRFTLKGEKKTLTEMLHSLSESKDAVERAETMRLINDGFSGAFAKYSAQTLYMISGAGSVEDKERKYKHPMEARNKGSHIPDEVVEALHKAVMSEAAPLARRFYRLKAAHLGLKTLRWSDRNAPMPFSDSSVIPYGEGIATVLAAYESFSPALASIIRDFIKGKRIDAPATKGKRGGAFNSFSVLPGNEAVSFTFLNYLGSNRDVMTLAHELGHGVHGILAGRAQGVLMMGAPIAYCETASVFGEMTTFNFLKDRVSHDGDKKAELALVMGKIDDVVNTVVRQIGFSNFERRLHGMDESYQRWGIPRKMSVEELDDLWLKTVEEVYGKSGDVFTYENAEHLWAYVGHFHRPFYVYGYAFGELLTHSLYAKKDELGDRFEPLYLDMLSSGGTKDVVELIRPFGLNPRDEDFWNKGIAISLGALIEEAEKLSNEMGIVV